MPKALHGQRTEGTSVPPSAQGGKTAQEGDISAARGSEGAESPAVSEENSDAGDTERSPFNIEAIVWSSDAKKSFVLINGVEFRAGDSVEGKTIARIERDHVVFQSQEGESIVRLKFK
jgi:type II secretory pathway component PulC